MQFLLIDDHPLFQLGFKSLCELLSTPPKNISNAHSCAQAEVFLKQKPALDVVFIDLGLPDGNGIDLLMAFRQQMPDVICVILSASLQPAVIQQTLSLGAQGYIPKTQDSSVIIKAIDFILSGGLYVPPIALSFNNNLISLTSRQTQILTYISQGDSNKEISKKVYLSEGGVRNNISVIFELLAVKNRSEAVAVAHSSGLINMT